MDTWTLLLEGFATALQPIYLLYALLGVLLGTAGVVGHLRARLPGGLRVVYLVVGVALLVPTDMFAGAGWMNLVAFVAGAGMVAFEFTRRVAASARTA